MMRRPLTMLTLVTVCGLLALLAVAALGAQLVLSSGAAAGGATHTWPLTLAPVPDDLALAQVSFQPARQERLSARSLRVTVSGPFGDDYMVAGAVRGASRGRLRALVLLVNRPSALLDPASVHLKLVARRSLGVATVRTLDNPLASSGSVSVSVTAKAALCELPLHGSALAADRLSVLDSRGATLPGFAAADALAQAYDLACGLPYASAFKLAIVRPSSPPQLPTPTTPAPTPTATSPQPPVGKLPGEGCKPAPGYACPG